MMVLDDFEKQKRAFDALLAYERNCLKYEAKHPQHLQYRVRIPRGERMSDFAMRFGTTVKEMKKHWLAVERTIDLQNRLNQ